MKKRKNSKLTINKNKFRELTNQIPTSLRDTKDLDYIRIFDSGFTRKPIKEAYHLICPELERRLSLIFAEGLQYYKDNTVTEAEITTARFGGPPDNLVRHMRRHLNLWLSGDRNEDHLAKVAWTIQELMHDESEGQCEHYNMFLKPENRVKRTRRHL